LQRLAQRIVFQSVRTSLHAGPRPRDGPGRHPCCGHQESSTTERHRRRQNENVPKNPECLLGSLHFVPSALPLNAFSAVVPISALSTTDSGWNHFLPPHVGSCVISL